MNAIFEPEAKLKMWHESFFNWEKRFQEKPLAGVSPTQAAILMARAELAGANGEDTTNFFTSQFEWKEEKPTGPQIVCQRGDSVTTKTIKWLWDFRIPAGKLSVLAGNPDQGKSLVTMYMVSQLTTGRPLYGSDPKPACEVLILAGEDEADDTIVPRLQAGGADLSKVHLLDSVLVRDGQGNTLEEREARLDMDIRAIEAMLNQNPDIRLIVIDPLSNYLGASNMNREQEVRAILVPLKGLAARTGVAIVSVMHLNKSTEASAIHRVGGAVAFTGVARAVWLFVEDPEDPDKHLMLRVKANIAKKTGGLVYQIKTKSVLVEDGETEQPYTEFTGETSLDTGVLQGGKPVGRPREERQGARAWLEEFLSEGSQTSEDVRTFGKRAGFSWATLKRVKDGPDSFIKVVRVDKHWEWLLSRPVEATI